MSSYTAPDIVVPIAIACAVIVATSGIHGIIVSRKRPDKLIFTLLLHAFIILAVVALGFLLHFLGSYSNLHTESVTMKDVNQYELHQILLGKLTVTEHGIWFSTIALIGFSLGVLNLCLFRKTVGKT